jgi:hypothetical protein
VTLICSHYYKVHNDQLSYWHSSPIAKKYYIPIQKKVNAIQPTFNGKNIHITPKIKAELDAVLDAYFSAPTSCYEMGVVQFSMVTSKNEATNS